MGDESKICPQCGKKFYKGDWEKSTVFNNEYFWNRKRFCSNKCAQKSNFEIRKKRENRKNI